MPEWDPYKVKIPKSGSMPDGTAVLDTLHHVVHVPAARRILEDGKLRAGLVCDESRLNKSRTSVTWLSANTWGLGSIYGNVQFTFSWSKLIEGRRFYWVEAMTSYSPSAYRILITDRDLSHSRHLTAYDPSSAKGPLRERGGTWYWNGNFTSEFMIDGDLELSECVSFEFISHNQNYCRAYGSWCPDKRAQPFQIGARVLAFLLRNNLHAIDHVLKIPSRYDPSRQLSEVVDAAISGILLHRTKKDRFTGGIKAKASRKAVLLGALALYGADQSKAAFDLIALLHSEEVFQTALREVVNDHFDISGWTFET